MGSAIHDDEIAKWDALARKKLDQLSPLVAGANFQAFSVASATMPGIAEFLGDLEGKHVVEYGCGLGELSVLLARSGARLTSFDISGGSIEVARRRAEINGLSDRIEFFVTGAEDLPFPDASFDVAFGKAILHHLDPAACAGTLARIVKPGGRAAFSEPMGMNPVLNFARDRVPYPGKNPPGGDQPVNYDEIGQWAAGFDSLEVREVQFFSMLERGLGHGTRIPPLRRLDARMLGRFPGLKRYCRYVSILLTK